MRNLTVKPILEFCSDESTDWKNKSWDVKYCVKKHENVCVIDVYDWVQIVISKLTDLYYISVYDFGGRGTAIPPVGTLFDWYWLAEKIFRVSNGRLELPEVFIAATVVSQIKNF